MRPTHQPMEHLINHICFLLDESGSMTPHTESVKQVFNAEVQRLRDQSVNLNQETRVSLFSFDAGMLAGRSNVLRLKNSFFDIDVMRVPTLTDYLPSGNTPLYDATIKTWEDLSTISQIYGNHAFLYYVITDGEENRSACRPDQFKTRIDQIQKSAENLTLAVLAPSAAQAHSLKLIGFPNVAVWDPSSADGFREAGETMRRATDTFMRSRSTGVRRVNNVFEIDTTQVSASVVKASLDPLKADQYRILPVRAKAVIQPFVESWKIAYRPGSCYYELTKRETIQSYKELMLLNRKNGQAFQGHAARSILGLPVNVECRVDPPSKNSEWDIFVQSTSYNRNLMPGTRLIVLE